MSLLHALAPVVRGFTAPGEERQRDGRHRAGRFRRDPWAAMDCTFDNAYPGIEALAGVSVGATLSAARIDAGLDIDDVATRTRLRPTVLRSMEEDDFSVCGGRAYVRGHLRTLAKVLGLEPEALVQQYEDQGSPQGRR
ncbi:MAG: helix-turn-helix domain-containing protein [Actinomycetales bacterium]|nr:helix-turn-helix domain-containing protein [Actinomycetales bacterium]